MKFFNNSSPGLPLVKDERLGLCLALGEKGRGRELTLIKLDGNRTPKTCSNSSKGFQELLDDGELTSIPQWEADGTPKIKPYWGDGESPREQVYLYDCSECGVQVDRQGHPGPMLLEAGLTEFEAGGAKRYAFVTPKAGDDRALVRANSNGAYTRGRHGTVKSYWGRPRFVTRGNFADGDAGRIGYASDELWVMNKNDALVVSPNNGGKNKSFVLFFNGSEVQRMDVEAFRTEVVGPLFEKLDDVQRAEAVRAAEAGNHKGLAEFLTNYGKTTDI